MAELIEHHHCEVCGCVISQYHAICDRCANEEEGEDG